MSAPAAGSGPAVSVVVINYQGREHLPPCLQALAAQIGGYDELIVIDNASTDGSERLVEELLPAARLVRMAANHGPCPARNEGLRLARNRWVLLVDNDAVLAPDVLVKLRAAADADPQAALVQPRSVLAHEPSRVHYDGGALHYVGVFSLRNFFTPLLQAEGQGVVAVPGAVSVALLCDRERVLAAGGFDARYFILFEDLDLSLRLGQRGARILAVEDALVHHRGGTSGVSFRGPGDYPRRRAFLHSRNRWLYLVKNYSWRTLLVAAPGFLLYDLAWVAFALRSGTFLDWLEGKVAFLRELPAVLRARRDVQASRTRPDRELLVGGPLTITAPLADGSGGRALRLLDRALAAWWSLVRPWAG